MGYASGASPLFVPLFHLPEQPPMFTSPKRAAALFCGVHSKKNPCPFLGLLLIGYYKAVFLPSCASSTANAVRCSDTLPQAKIQAKIQIATSSAGEGESSRLRNELQGVCLGFQRVRARGQRPRQLTLWSGQGVKPLEMFCNYFAYSFNALQAFWICSVLTPEKARRTKCSVSFGSFLPKCSRVQKETPVLTSTSSAKSA